MPDEGKRAVFSKFGTCSHRWSTSLWAHRRETVKPCPRSKPQAAR